MGAPFPAPAQVLQTPAEPSGILVSGVGLVLARPELARLTLSVETRNKDASVAAKANASRLDAVLRTLKKMGVLEKDILTSGLEIGSDDPQKNRVVSNSVEVVVRDIKKVGRVVDATLAAGANGVSALTFEARDTAALYDEALRRAVLDARRKAKVLASAVKARIELVSVSESGADNESDSNNLVAGRGYFYSGVRPTTPIVPGRIEVRAGVTLRYRFVDPPVEQREKE
jgi:uncharacterized protein